MTNTETEKCVNDVAESEKSSNTNKPPVNLRNISTYKVSNGKSKNQTGISSSTESSNSNSERASTISSEINTELTEEESAVLNQILNMGNLDKPVPEKCDNKLETNDLNLETSNFQKKPPVSSRNSSSSR